ncbi:hypothetical protein [Sphingomonas oryzagri]|jgi:hypothetical protein|uniref:Conjugal transfer protein n=1 Tax=Sphingomonas oryzagri TaxID=3042314 RepID=A0ABT6MXJ5_9SPHN|nr:hypothetical protein [Sphingomonas oryzagri]MDH7637543.1 hypothetical protein [Sphingomonas oryzagri]
MRKSLVPSFVGVVLLASTAAVAGPVTMSASGAVQLLPGQIQAGYRQNLEQLRRDALAQQAKDGGTLTADHQAALDRKLDRINDDYRRVLLNQNPLAVNADGSSVAPGAAPVNWTVSSLMHGGTQP